jgi:hypothetical protein
MAQRVWTVEEGERCHVITLEHGHWSGRRRIRVDGELVHESRVVFDLGRTRHRFHVDEIRFALMIRTNGATYGYDLVRDEPGNPRSTEPAPATSHEGSGDEPVPVLRDPASPAAAPTAGTLAPAGPLTRAEETLPSPMVIRALPDGEGASRLPHVGTLFDASFGVLTLALFAALVGAALDLPDAGAIGSALVVGVAGAWVGRRRGERAGGETLFSLLGGLAGAGLGLGLGAGLFSLLLLVALALLLLAPLPGAASE